MKWEFAHNEAAEGKFMNLAQRLEAIVAKYEPGQRIPSERELAAKLGVARMTLRNGTESLILAGKLERRAGSGTYVANTCYSLSAGCRSFSAEMEARGLVPRNSLISIKKIAADKVLANKLRIPVNYRVLKFTRIRFGDETPMAIQYTSIPLCYIGDISPADLEGSLEDLFLLNFGISIVTSQTEISGEFPDSKKCGVTEYFQRHSLFSQRDH
jgi:GntR family transcriptional regulator